MADKPAPVSPAVVSVRSCNAYPQVHAALQTAFEDLELGSFFRAKRVLLKVNLMRGAAPELARTTHPELLRAVIRLIQDGGGDPVVVESSGVLGFTREVFEATGTAAVARAEGVPWRSLDAGPFRRAQLGGHVLRERWMPELLWECDLRVSLPKLKSHTLTGVTAALKNLVGIQPGATKCAMHQLAPTPGQLGDAVADLYQALPFHLGVCDAVVGLEGGGSAAGRPVPLGFVAASRDLVALDASCCALVGVDPMAVPTTRAAHRRGLGEARLAQIELRGRSSLGPVARLAAAPFDPKRLGPVSWASYRQRGRLLRPFADRRGCTRCGACARVCPVQAITLDPWPRVSDACMRCYACSEHCPEDVMLLACQPWMRPALAERTRGLPMGRLAPLGLGLLTRLGLVGP